jgi:hypothetical protein
MNPLDGLLYDLIMVVLRIKDKSTEENICADDYETMILETLDSAGVEFTR